MKREFRQSNFNQKVISIRNKLLLGEVIEVSSRNEFKSQLKTCFWERVWGNSMCFTFTDLKSLWRLPKFHMTPWPPFLCPSVRLYTLSYIACWNILLAHDAYEWSSNGLIGNIWIVKELEVKPPEELLKMDIYWWEPTRTEKQVSTSLLQPAFPFFHLWPAGSPLPFCLVYCLHCLHKPNLD